MSAAWKGEALEQLHDARGPGGRKLVGSVTAVGCELELLIVFTET